jgi:hypothetical protein
MAPVGALIFTLSWKPCWCVQMESRCVFSIFNLSRGDNEADGAGKDFDVEIIAGQHLTVKAELYLLVGVNINCL